MSTVSYKCQNCGSPLVIEPGQNQAICPYCRSQNVLTVGADGQVTLSLVQKVDSIDNKTDQILAMQKAASMGHLLSTTTNEHLHFLQNEFKPRMVDLETEKTKVGTFNGNCGCGCLAACVFFGLMGFFVLGDSSAAGGGFIILVIAIGGIVAIVGSAAMRRKAIQDKMDALTQKNADFKKQIDEMRSTISSHR